MSSVKNREASDLARRVVSVHSFVLPPPSPGHAFTAADALDLIEGADRHRVINPDAVPVDAVLLPGHGDGATARLLAGRLGEHNGPPLTPRLGSLIHASVAPGGQLLLPWSVSHTATAYVLAGRAIIGTEYAEVAAGQYAVLERKVGVVHDTIAIDACDACPQGLEILLVGAPGPWGR